MSEGGGRDRSFLRDFFEELYEQAPCGYVTTRTDGTITRVNETFVGFARASRGALVGRRFSDLLSVAGRIYHETHVAPLLHMHGSVSELALELQRADGSRVPVLVNMVQRTDEAGIPRNRWITVFNASERRRYERELLAERRRAEAASQAKAEFLSMISHEIRTPLNAIMGAARLLARTELDGAQTTCARILNSSSRNLLELVDEILDFSKIEAGRLILEPTSLDLAELVSETVDRFTVAAAEKMLTLHLDVDPQLPRWVEADPVKLRKVLTNLVGNAVKFTDSGSVTTRVRCGSRIEDTVEVEMSVTDTGVGIPVDQQRHIFEAFRQASSEVGRRFGGTGLGLAISQKLLALHGGTLTVDSTPGAGSTFACTLRLPLAQPPASNAAAEAGVDIERAERE